MSQPSAAAEAEFIKAATKAVMEEYISLALTTLLPVYEVLITLDQEITAVWMGGKKLSVGSILLVSTRWCMVLAAIADKIPTPTPPSCKAASVLTVCLEMIGLAQVAVFSALRVSAIWGRNQILFFVIFALGLAPVVTNGLEVAFYVYSSEPGQFCPAGVNLSNRTVSILVPVTRAPLIVADAVVLILTWMKTYRQVMDARRTGITISISMCLLRDGTLYFLVLLILNILELITHRTPNTVIISIFVATIPPILVNRFMLNLRQVDTQNDTRSVGSIAPPQFRAPNKIYGNFAEPLGHGDSFLRDDVEGLDGADEESRAEDVFNVEDDKSPEIDNPASTSSMRDITEVYRTEESVRGTDAEVLHRQHLNRVSMC